VLRDWIPEPRNELRYYKPSPNARVGFRWRRSCPGHIFAAFSEMVASHYVLLGVVLFLASVLHSAAGFAFALLAIPVLLIGGFQPQAVIAITAVSVVVHGCLSIVRSSEKPDWKGLSWLIAIGAAMQPIGNWILSQILFLSRGQICQIFGCILLAVVILRLTLRPEPREHLPPVWGVITMIASGIISGMSGMGGPPIVFWLIAHKWSNDRMRVTMWAIFSSMAVTNLCWMSARFGEPVWNAIVLGLLFTPVTLLGTLPGSRIGAKMSPVTMRNVATTILVVVAVYAILQPMVLPRTGR